MNQVTVPGWQIAETKQQNEVWSPRRALPTHKEEENLPSHCGLLVTVGPQPQATDTMPSDQQRDRGRGRLVWQLSYLLFNIFTTFALCPHNGSNRHFGNQVILLQQRTVWWFKDRWDQLTLDSSPSLAILKDEKSTKTTLSRYSLTRSHFKGDGRSEINFCSWRFAIYLVETHSHFDHMLIRWKTNKKT